jgi:glyceraldehyde-3-phosphate dehydrogenase (NADP+)
MNIPDKIENIFSSEDQIPQKFQIKKQIIQKEYLINGEILKWEGPMFDVYSPVHINNGSGNKAKLLGQYPLLTEKESLQALDAAVKAYDNGRGEWPLMSVEDRIKHVEKFIFKMVEKRDEIINLIMWEICKTYKSAAKEFDRTVEYIKDTIDALKELNRTSSRLTIVDKIFAQVRRAPLGVVLCMGPFNYPLNETFATLIPAIIMGNTVIFKPPKYGVLLHQPLLEAFRDAFPKGVVNSIYGDGPTVIGPLMKSGKIDVLAFIGSCKVADILKQQHPAIHRLRSVLGLGAKNAGIILEDADLDLAVKESVLGSLSYNGQRCTALKMLFVHEKIIDQFLKKFSEEVNKLNIGMPWDDNVNITPLPEDNKTDYFVELVEDAKKHGAEVMNEHGGIRNKSFFFPAVLYPVNEKMKIYHEEQFGPVIPIASFNDIKKPLDYIVNSNFGQQVSIFGKNTDFIAKLIDPLVNQVCRVNINSQCQRGPDEFPFTARKDSAEGTLSVSDALRVFTIRSLVAFKDNDLNKGIVKTILQENKSNFLSTDFIL